MTFLQALQMQITVNYPHDKSLKDANVSADMAGSAVCVVHHLG